MEEAMFDSQSVHFPDRYSDQPLATGSLPWQVVALLLGLAIVSGVAAILYPDVFGARMDQF